MQPLEDEDLTPEEAPEEQPSKEWDDEVEAEARAFGWKSVDEWEGKVPAGFIDDPRRFMERAEKFSPFQKLRERLTQTEEIARRSEAAISAQVKRFQEAEKARYEAEIATLKAQQLSAVEVGDVDEFKRTTDRIDGMRAPEVPEMEAPPESDPVVPLYDAHPWLKDPFLREQGHLLTSVALKQGLLSGKATIAEQAAYAEREVRKYFPHIFPQEAAPKKVAASPVEGGGGGIFKAKSGFDGLPSSARAQFSRFVADGVFKDTEADRKQYFEDYNNG